MAITPVTQTSRQTKTATTSPVASPDYISIVQNTDQQILKENADNPVYNLIIENEKNLSNEAAIQQVYELLTKGLEDGTATPEQFDEIRKNLTDFNAYMQAMRRQLGSEQIKGITDKDYANFQKIVNSTRGDVAKFTEQLMPLNKLSTLFTKFGAEGNIIEKLNKAVAEKRIRDMAIAKWQFDHNEKLQTVQNAIAKIKGEIYQKTAALKEKEASTFAYFNARSRIVIESEISQLNKDLEERNELLEKLKAEEPIVKIDSTDDVEKVDPEILELQDIGGEAFKEAILRLRDDTELTLAKISANFDEAISGLNNTRELFINLDRNCGDANIALTILEIAVQRAEAKAKVVATQIISDLDKNEQTDLGKLERMEQEQRSQQILGFKDFLSTFLTDVGIAVTSIRSGQTVVQNILRMNSAALQSANTHKMTGIANTSDAVTIIIGSIIEVCNRAASRVLADGLTAIRNMAQEGNRRLAEGTYEAINMQNAQLQNLVSTVSELTAQTKNITENSVDLLAKQLSLVEQMRSESDKLSAATADANKMRFTVAAADPVLEKKQEPEVKQGFSFRRHN